jgi:hypothetical protein
MRCKNEENGAIHGERARSRYYLFDGIVESALGVETDVFAHARPELPRVLDLEYHLEIERYCSPEWGLGVLRQMQVFLYSRS